MQTALDRTEAGEFLVSPSDPRVDGMLGKILGGTRVLDEARSLMQRIIGEEEDEPLEEIAPPPNRWRRSVRLKLDFLSLCFQMHFCVFSSFIPCLLFYMMMCH